MNPIEALVEIKAILADPDLPAKAKLSLIKWIARYALDKGNDAS